MKMTQEHYAHMKSAIAAVWSSDLNKAERKALRLEGKAKDIEKRLRWDWSYAAKISPWICDNLYSYLDDTHIDTALKQVMKELNAQG